MLIQAQIDLLDAAMQQHGVEALKEVFTVATIMGDLDTMAHIASAYTEAFTQQEQYIMTELVTLMQDVVEAFDTEEDTATHTLH